MEMMSGLSGHAVAETPTVAARALLYILSLLPDTSPPDNRFFFGTVLGNHVFANEQVGSTTLLFTYITLVTGH